jgi:hypothetical protein
MRKLRVGRRIIPLLFLFILILALWLPLKIVPAGYTRIDLTGGDGRPMLSVVLPDGKTLVFSWRNSLFGLQVKEIFSARGGVLVLSSVTFADPGGTAPPRVPAEEVDDYYHTGGAFRAEGLSRPFTKVVYLIGEIGDPKMQAGGRTIHFKREMGFGGRVILTTARPNLYEILLKEKRS